MSGDEGLGYEDDLVVAWEARPALSEEAVHRMNSQAVRILKALAALEDPPREASDDASVVLQELHRVEGKLDLVLGMIADIAEARLGLPERSAVMVRAGSLSVTAASPGLAVEDGQAGVVSIYLMPGVPVPVRLPAVAHVSNGARQLRFDGLVAETRNALERHVFRHHRRAVARARREAARGD